MNKISSKALSLDIAHNFIDVIQNDSKTHDGILLLTAFGVIYGKFHKFSELSDSNSVSDILLNIKSKHYEDLISEGNEIFGDGTTITLNDAVVKYSSGMTLNMGEIIIFCDQIIGYYPVDLKACAQLQK